ncbi:MAG: ATP-binding protein [Acidobacteriota bacterium]
MPVHAFVWLCRSSRPELYRFHPVAWDDACLLPFPGLDRLLVGYAERFPTEGIREIDRLIDTYPSQRSAALRARAILLAREASGTADLARLDDTLAGLPEGKRGFLQDTPELRRRAHEICTLQARIDTLDRPFLREPFAALLVKEIESFEGRIAGFRPPLSTEFRKAARKWLEIARKQHEVARAAIAREPTRQVFRAGAPVDREKEAFVERASILGELERQVMLASGCPVLLVYGRRRVGKSSLLKNLEGFLPPRVSIASLSMQKAEAFTSLGSLIDLIAEQISGRLPGIEKSASQTPDLRDLARLLHVTEARLEAEGLRLLLAIDEFENLDRKIGEGVFSEDLLAVLRESMQNHRHLIWTLAGSHRIDELTHAPWASYLVSARTVEVPPFEPAETRLLLTEPLKHSSLWRAAGSEAPRFEPGFWGTGGIERIHEETGGWPHLVQLVAERVVDLVNDGGVNGADERLLDRALDRAVENGYSVFYELIERESALPGELGYLRRFAREETLPIPEDDAVDRSLRRRLLVVPEGNRYRLRAPIMARWLRRA